MKSGSIKSGFTLIEMVVVVAVIVILASMVVGIARRIDDQGKERLCRETLTLIDNALEQFRDFGYEYKSASYTGLDFPVDCNGFSELNFTGALQFEFGATTIIDVIPNDPCQIDNSGSEALYFFLSQVPDCRLTLDKIDKSLISNKDKNGYELTLVINGTPYPLNRFIDPWKTALRYDYYEETIFPLDLTTRKTFPIVTSAGADKKFGTNDDIINRQPK